MYFISCNTSSCSRQFLLVSVHHQTHLQGRVPVEQVPAEQVPAEEVPLEERPVRGQLCRNCGSASGTELGEC